MNCHQIPMNKLLTVNTKISILKLVGASYLDNRRSQSSLICDCANQLVRIGCSELSKVVSKCCKQRYRCFDFHETPKHNVMCFQDHFRET